MTGIVERGRQRGQWAAESTLRQAVGCLVSLRERRSSTVARLEPSFIIIGAQRCGTTSLYSYLSKHPQIAGALQKEVHFFDRDFHRGPAWYGAHFPSETFSSLLKGRMNQRTVLTGEASPYYFFHPHAPARVRETLPRVKLILMLRDPVERARSHFRHEVAKGIEKLSFEAAIEVEPARLEGEVERMLEDPLYTSFNHQHFSYVARGMYLEQLHAWRKHFGAEAMFIVNSNDFFRDPGRYHSRLLEFLGLPVIPLRHYKQQNSYRPTQVTDSVNRRLLDLFTEPNQRLYEYLKTDFGWPRA